MAQAEAIPVSGGIPPLPATAVVRERGNAPSQPQPANIPPAGQGADLLNVPPSHLQHPGFVQTQPQQQPEQVQQAPAADSDLVALLAALTKQQAPAQPQPVAPATPATAPAAPVNGDPLVASLSAVLSSAGIDVQRAVGKAIEYGDPSLIDVHYLTEKGGANAALVKSAAESIVQAAVAAEAAMEQNVYSKFGGESNWDASLQYFAKTANPAVRDYAVGMLKSQNPALVEQASNLILDHVKAQGALLQPAGLVQTGAAGAFGDAPLGKDEFKSELQKLNPQDRGYEEARGKLFARRQAGKKLGY